MKRKILLVATVVSVLAATIFGGLVYAAPASAPPAPNKLVGFGVVGCGGLDPQTRWETRLLITNPNTLDTINLNMVRIYDRDGVKQYEGPFLRMFLLGEQLTPPYPEVTTLQPHQMELMRLSQWTGGVDDAPQTYTVEIFWSGKWSVLPLMGTVSKHVTNTYGDGRVTLAIGDVSMENMKGK